MSYAYKLIISIILLSVIGVPGIVMAMAALYYSEVWRKYCNKFSDKRPFFSDYAMIIWLTALKVSVVKCL